MFRKTKKNKNGLYNLIIKCERLEEEIIDNIAKAYKRIESLQEFIDKCGDDIKRLEKNKEDMLKLGISIYGNNFVESFSDAKIKGE